MRFSGRSTDENPAEFVIRIRQTDVGWSKLWVGVYCLLKVADALVDVVPGGLVEGELPSQVAFVHLGRDMACNHDPRAFLSGDGYVNLLHDRFRHIALKSQHVPQFAIV